MQYETDSSQNKKLVDLIYLDQHQNKTDLPEPTNLDEVRK